MRTERQAQARMDAKSPAMPAHIMHAIVQDSYGAADKWPPDRGR